jgi:hypothetical protein
LSQLEHIAALPQCGHPQQRGSSLYMTLDPPSALSFALGAVVMIGGVLAPLGYVFVSNNKALMKRG